MNNKIIITNEDTSFQTFVKLLHDEHLIPNVENLRCKRGPQRMTAGNKYKKVELEFIPFEGEYTLEFKDTELKI